jgi:manganese transport system permease protein
MLATGLGVIVSYWLDASTAGCIVLVQTGLFLVTMVLAPRHGLLARRRPPRP